MPANTMTDLYVEKLKDLYSAEHQILKALPKMVQAATHEALRDAFETHRLQTETHVERLDKIFEELGKSPKGKMCRGVQGIIEEGGELMKQDPDAGILDVGLLSSAQSVEHYEMANYGSARTWAEQLGYAAHASLLQQTLEEEQQTDELLTALAIQTINRDADVGISSRR